MALKRILLAEDDPVLRKIYAHVLALEGYLVTVATDGIEALEKVAADEHDMLVIDVMMPRMDGLSLCREVRHRHHPDVPILFLTALDDADTLQRCTDAGADDYLVKEGSPESLLDRVDYWRRFLSGELREEDRRPRLQELQPGL